jgi:SAM-dependent methyltransferase
VTGRTGRVGRALRRAYASAAATIFPVRWKEFHELRYWKTRKQQEGELSNKHYSYFYTEHFGLDKAFYSDKVILDIGCGPRGSLEWAGMASQRMGLDPLADKYLRLGADRHGMEYLHAPAEAIPLAEGSCDVVCSFNSLDHVENVEQAVREIGRVTKPGGLFLLLVDVNHPPTACEPHELTPRMLIDLLQPAFVVLDLKLYCPTDGGMYRSIQADNQAAAPESTKERGYLSARCVRRN